MSVSREIGSVWPRLSNWWIADIIFCAFCYVLLVVPEVVLCMYAWSLRLSVTINSFLSYLILSLDDCRPRPTFQPADCLAAEQCRISAQPSRATESLKLRTSLLRKLRTSSPRLSLPLCLHRASRVKRVVPVNKFLRQVISLETLELVIEARRRLPFVTTGWCCGHEHVFTECDGVAMRWTLSTAESAIGNLNLPVWPWPLTYLLENGVSSYMHKGEFFYQIWSLYTTFRSGLMNPIGRWSLTACAEMMCDQRTVGAERYLTATMRCRNVDQLINSCVGRITTMRRCSDAFQLFPTWHSALFPFYAKVCSTAS